MKRLDVFVWVAISSEFGLVLKKKSYYDLPTKKVEGYQCAAVSFRGISYLG